MVEEGTISRGDLDLFYMTDDPVEAAEVIQRALEEGSHARPEWKLQIARARRQASRLNAANRIEQRRLTKKSSKKKTTKKKKRD